MFKTTPLSASFFLFGLLGSMIFGIKLFLGTIDPTWGFLMTFFFAIIFIASLISITPILPNKAELEARREFREMRKQVMAQLAKDEARIAKPTRKRVTKKKKVTKKKTKKAKSKVAVKKRVVKKKPTRSKPKTTIKKKVVKKSVAKKKKAIKRKPVKRKTAPKKVVKKKVKKKVVKKRKK